MFLLKYKWSTLALCSVLYTFEAITDPFTKDLFTLSADRVGYLEGQKT